MDAKLSLREKQKQNTRLEIAREALQLFHDKGFENVSVEEIAAAAGVSRATFFNYFKQKDQILTCAVESRVEQMMELFREAKDTFGSISMREVIAAFARFSEENELSGRAGQQVFIHALSDAGSRQMLSDMRQRITAAVAGVLKEAGYGVPSVAVADCVFSIYLGTNVEWIMRDDLPRGWLAKTTRDRLQMLMKARTV